MWAWVNRDLYLCTFSAPPSFLSKCSLFFPLLQLLFLIFLWAQAAVGSSIILHLKSSSTIPQPETCRSLDLPVLLCFLSATMKRSRSALLPYLHLFSSCACLHSLNQPQSLSEPVRSQTERVSRGLERGIISALLPLSLPFSRSPSVYPPPLHLSLLHHLTSPSLLSSPLSKHIAQSPFHPSRFLSSFHLSPCWHLQEQWFISCLYLHTHPEWHVHFSVYVSTHLHVRGTERWNYYKSLPALIVFALGTVTHFLKKHH